MLGIAGNGGDHRPSDDEARRRLVRACRTGPVTLVLGAGISYSRGVPLWDDVVQRLIEVVACERSERSLLERVQAVVARELGDEVAARVHLGSHPLEPQLTLEWIKHALERPEVRARLAVADPALGQPGDADSAFISLLRWALYRDVRPAGEGDALAVVGAAVCRQLVADRRRLIRIVTLNADDLLEREAERASGGERCVLAPIVRPSQHPAEGSPPPIPVYHLHGYLPREPDDPLAAPDRLVFTDAQFWSTTANPMSFANRLFAHALHDSRCVFAGLSMRDVNLMRWLAVTQDEVLDDLAGRPGGGDPEASLQRHFWLHGAGDDPSGVLRDVLARRGVRSIQLEDWGASDFGRLLAGCFDVDE